MLRNDHFPTGNCSRIDKCVQLVVHTALSLVFTTALALAFAAPAAAQNILFVSSSAGPAASDVSIVGHLQSQGFSVSIVDDNVVTEADSIGMDLIVVSSTVTSGKVAGTFTFTAIPLVTWEAWIFDDLDLTGPARNTDYGELSNRTTIDVVAGHPLAAGLSGPTAVTTASRAVRYGVPAPTAIVAATVDGDPTRATLFAYESGEPLLTYTAPARRVGLFFDETTFDVATPATLTLFDTAINWALGAPTNQPPSVSAGANFDAFVGVAANLSGSVDDDGISLPLTLAWTALSGPGNAVFAAPNAANTTVTFDAPGTYVLQLEADDGQFNAADTANATVTVMPPTNQPPTVTAADGSATVGLSATLSGSVTDDGIAGPLTLTWTQLTGPGTATIAQPNQAVTSVTFSDAGAYTLQLEADDTEFQVQALATFVVAPPPNQAPSVTANDGSAIVGQSAPLSGSVTDDGLAGPLTLAWTQQSGPGTATIAQPNQAVTSVSFDTAGTYTLQLEADDSEFQDQDVATFTVSDPPTAQQILFVSANAGPAAADVNVVARLQSQGFDVTVADDSFVATSDAEGMDLIVVSSTVSSGNVGTKFTATAVPLVTWEAWIFDDLGLTDTGAGTNYGSIANLQNISVLGGHPLAAGLSGTVPVTTSPRAVRWGVPAPTAIVAATVDGDPARATVFGYESGQALVGNTAPARRVGLFLDETTIDVSTPQSEALLDAAIAWALGVSVPTNQAPSVSAGPNIAAVVGVAANLSGSVTDDGVALPLTIEWTALSGPGNAIFAAADQPTTTVTFDAAGTYVLQLTADDGEFDISDTSSATVTVSQPTNQPPSVTANNGAATVGQAVALSGSVSDDGVAGPLTLAWTQLTGPGTASIAQPNQAVTSVTFSAAGTYTLELEADDTEFQAQAIATFNVSPPANLPPTVTANSGSATVGQSVALSGSVSDDGVAGPLTLAWTQLTGPGTASIAQPNQAVTSVTFSAAGTYTLELEADDSEFQAQAIATFSVSPPANQPPTVTANSGSAIVGQAVALSGSVGDDGVAGPLTLAWTQLTGPGTASIAQPNQAATSVTFSAAGTYTLELEADDTEFQAQAIATFSVSAPPTAQKILFVSSNASPAADDVALVSRLQSQGFELTIVDDSFVSANDAIGMDLIVVSSTVSSGNVGDTFTFTAVPLVTWEAWIFDDLDLTGPAAGTDYGSLSNLQNISVLGGHPLAAGLSGTLAVTTSPRRVRWGAPLPSAIVAATVAGDPARATLFAYEAGSPMLTYTAPARRVGLFFDETTAVVATPNGEALFDAAIAWALGPVSNQPPVVSAGPDIGAFANIATNLAGNVSDDGIAGPLTIAWSLVSGPGNANFATPGQANTSVTFDAAGSYVVQLEANDSEFSVNASATVTVSAQQTNQPPVVTADDGNALVGQAVTLSGTVSDDAVAGPLTIAWTQLSGPGTATIAQPNQAATTVSFSAAGTYTLELEADDTEFQDQAIASFSVSNPPTSENILFVTGALSGAAGDPQLIDQLEFWGYTVTVVDDDAVQSSDASGMDLIIVSSTVSSSKVGNKFTNSAVPLVTWEIWIFDDLGLTGPTISTDYGSVAGQRTLEMVGAHPLTAGFAGSVTVTNSNQPARWGVPGPNAVVAATVEGNPALATIFGYEAGQAMASGNAPARRVGFFSSDQGGWSADGLALFRSAIAWAASESAANSVRILPLGDSITNGRGGFWSYRDALWNQLAADGCDIDFVGSLNGPSDGSAGPGLFDRDHEGHSGLRTDEILSNLNAWLPGNVPEYVLLHLGTNDVLQSTSQAAAKENLRDIITELRAANPSVTILLAQIIAGRADREPATQSLNVLIAQLAAEEDTVGSPVVLVDQHTGYDNLIHNFDDIHPNDLGDALIAGRWFTPLRPLIGAYCTN